LERPLVGAEDDKDYEQAHGVSRPDAEGYHPPSAVVDSGRASSFTTSGFPTQTDELKEVSILSKDAAEILWEMRALGEGGDRVEEMESTAKQLQAQLRGLINDYSGGDEQLLSSALESFDMITRCIDDQKPQIDDQTEIQSSPIEEPAAVAAPTDDHAEGLGPAGAAVAQPRAPPPAAPAALSETPLISFD